MRAMNDPVEVDMQHGFQVVGVEIPQFAQEGDAGVVDHVVERAPLCHTALDQLGQRLAIRHVEGHGGRVAARADNGLHRSVALYLIAVNEVDPGSATRQFYRKRPPETRGSPCDDYRAVPEVWLCHCQPCGAERPT
jgi:hypothetical protein